MDIKYYKSKVYAADMAFLFITFFHFFPSSLYIWLYVWYAFV